ncbi:hypothetical protein [Paenibacillus popilliae]|uniref:hypothetical protein n=1 Tax=Paenibacillus popilliae TaxID=78057 RepID=UPI0011D1992F|nr:hypothetical protein [Paenibacillus popilliae]
MPTIAVHPQFSMHMEELVAGEKDRIVAPEESDRDPNERSLSTHDYRCSYNRLGNTLSSWARRWIHV